MNVYSKFLNNHTELVSESKAKNSQKKINENQSDEFYNELRSEFLETYLKDITSKFQGKEHDIDSSKMWTKDSIMDAIDNILEDKIMYKFTVDGGYADAEPSAILAQKDDILYDLYQEVVAFMGNKASVKFADEVVNETYSKKRKRIPRKLNESAKYRFIKKTFKLNEAEKSESDIKNEFKKIVSSLKTLNKDVYGVWANLSNLKKLKSSRNFDNPLKLLIGEVNNLEKVSNEISRISSIADNADVNNYRVYREK